ncbi:MAG: hypothetical protein ACRC8A_20595 [Microcoleaceae cyanobacterium]
MNQSSGKSICLLSAELAIQHLPTQQFIRIIHVRSSQTYGWCKVEDLPITLHGQNISDFWVVPLDSGDLG